MHPASAMSPERADSRVKFLWIFSVKRRGVTTFFFLSFFLSEKKKEGKITSVN